VRPSEQWLRTSGATLRSAAEVPPRSDFLEESSRARVSPGTALVAALVTVGIALRLTYYLLNPALSSDEAALALNLMHRSYSGLFGELDFNQAAPAGFLVLQKLLISALGPDPYVLRLLPFAAGVGAVVLFYPVARRLVGRRGAILAFALFTVSDPLVTYAATNKQYSIDVAVSLALYAVVLALPERFGWRQALILTLSGTIAVWLSHASVFVLAAIIAALLVASVRAGRPAEFATISLTVVVWLASFAAAYSLTHTSVAHLQRSLGHLTLLSDGGRPGLVQTYGGIVRDLFGIPMFGHGIRSAIALVAMALAIAGLVVLWRARPQHAALLVVPAVLVLVAAKAGKYALYPRTCLFLIPALAILAGRGTLFLAATRQAPARFVGGVIFAMLLAVGTYTTVDHLGSRRQMEPVRTLRYLTQNARRGDSLYLHLSAQLDFRYYLECGCFGTSNMARKATSLWPVRAPTSDRTFLSSASPHLLACDSKGTAPSDYRSDLAPLRGRARVWVLMMDPTAASQRALAAFLRQTGRRIDRFPRSDAQPLPLLALYDLR
jgi:Dolichyl-phosphate-mannose-protein mannosyltransferase